MSIHEQNTRFIDDLILGLSSTEAVDTNVNLGSRDRNAILNTIGQAQDVEQALAIFSSKSIEPFQFYMILAEKIQQDVNTQQTMFSRILDIPPYIDDSVDDFI